MKNSHDSFLFMLRQTILASSRVTTAAPKAFVSAQLRLDYTTVKQLHYISSRFRKGWISMVEVKDQGEKLTRIFSFYVEINNSCFYFCEDGNI